jgi:hypothetical protein
MRINRGPPPELAEGFGALHALAINDGGGGTGFAFRLFATLLVERVMNAIQRAVPTPQAKVVVHGAARRQIFGI